MEHPQVISVHEYELKPGVEGIQFERVRSGRLKHADYFLCPVWLNIISSRAFAGCGEGNTPHSGSTRARKRGSSYGDRLISQSPKTSIRKSGWFGKTKFCSPF